MRPQALPVIVLAAILAFTGCSGHEQTRQYPLRGQVLAIGTLRPDGRTDVTVKHEDIAGFMPAMTMPYFVKDAKLLDGLTAGDLVTASLVVKGSEIYLADIRKTGHAALPEGAKRVAIMDVMQPGDEVPVDAMQDQAGMTRRLQDWRGRAVAVTFVYTRCPLPDFCPLMDRNFGALQQRIEADPSLRTRIHLVSISFDPLHDTLPIIEAHARARGAHVDTWSYLTGTPAAIQNVSSRFGVSTIVESDAAQTITHNLRTAVIDGHGRLVKIYTGNDWSVDALLVDLRDASAR